MGNYKIKVKVEIVECNDKNAQKKELHRIGDPIKK